MITEVIVILLVCFKLDYTTSLPDIIRIGEEIFFLVREQQQKFLERRKSFFMQHRVARKNFASRNKKQT